MTHTSLGNVLGTSAHIGEKGDKLRLRGFSLSSGDGLEWGAHDRIVASIWTEGKVDSDCGPHREWLILSHMTVQKFKVIT